MIDASIYDLTQEQASYILNHWEILAMFYIIGVLVTAGFLINYIYKGSVIIINKIKNKRLKNDRYNL